MPNGTVIKREVNTDHSLALTPDQAAEAIEQTLPTEQRFLSHLRKPDQEKMVLALQVLRYIRDGKSLRTIADLMGFSHNTAAHYKNLALASIAIPLVEEQRKHELEVIEQRIERLTPKANAGDTKAEDQLRKYLEHRSRLTGTQKPTQVHSSVTVSRADQEVASLLDGLTIEGEVVNDLESPDIAEVLSSEADHA